MKRIFCSKLGADILNKYLVFSKSDKILVLPVCTMEKYVYDIDSWDTYFGVDGILYKKIVLQLSLLGANSDNITFLNYYEYNSTIDFAGYNYLIIPGGDAELGLKRIEQLNLKNVIKSYGGVIVGYSAGALILFDHFFLSPNWFYKEMMYCDGLNIPYMPKYMIEVHYDHSIEMKKNVYNAMDFFKCDCVLIGDDAVIVYDEELGCSIFEGDTYYFEYNK